MVNYPDVAAIRRQNLAHINNRELGKTAWQLAVGLVAALSSAVWVTLAPESAAQGPDFGPLLIMLRGVLAAAVIAITVGSVAYPALKAEQWLDKHFPSLTAPELPHEYHLVDDVIASAGTGVVWGLRLGGVYAFLALTFLATSLLTAFAEAGYELSAANVRALTIMNSFGVLLLAAAVATAGLYYAIERVVVPAARGLETPATSALKIQSDRPSMADGGAADPRRQQDGDHS